MGDDNVCSPGEAWDSSVTAERRNEAGEWGVVDSLPTPRDRFAPVTLADGRVLVTGGTNGGTPEILSFSSTYIFDPSSRTWSRSGLLDAARSDPAFVVLADGRVLVTGGYAFLGGTPRMLATSELFDPSLGTWSSTGGLRSARYGAHAVTLSDGRVLVVGGWANLEGSPFGSDEPMASAELYDPVTGRWSTVGSLDVARSRFALVALADGGALVAGGWTFVDAGEFGSERLPTSTVERFDPASERWIPAADMVTAAADRAAVRLDDGRVLVAGGDVSVQEADLDGTRDAFTAAVELYDPATQTWSSADPLPVPRADAKALLLDDGSVLIATGFGAPPNPGEAPSCPLPDPRVWRYGPA